MKLTIFFPLAAFLSWTVAESLTDASPCLNRCLTDAADVAGCISQFDFECTCPSPAFKETLGTCLEISCTPEDLTVAGQLHKERCGSAPQ
ncbi:hypothetical protein N7491_002733 [Penicillium cf. griseofulvum]|uniref:CFEM domain-containing protein n=1 Tax=Penicillium cf. griseofulvum TaxID=2972120 RepID=A0A9W9MSE8_9EURO|nr:hypothetical protein N7472_003100 [Penicillium cf. griseofulvum]KAJ5440327.1 hypothetical protein N7491_002733 [Penicillium cf. griseofulvum]KAJ5448375.1 hypothetical protein N7445_003196 [Penicillium cf. griseofulvum]